MSVSNLLVRQFYTGNGATTSFPITFALQDNTQLVVKKKVISTGVVTTLTGSDYSITGGNPGTAISISPALSSDNQIILSRVTTLQQIYSFLNNTTPLSKNIENALDRLLEMIQEAADAGARSIRLSDTTTLAFDPTLPDDLEADRMLMIGADGLSLALGPTPEELSEAAANVVAVTAALTAAEAAQAAAETAQAAAETAETNAETAETNAETAQAAAETAQAAAETAETNAAASAAAAAQSAIDAAAAADPIPAGGTTGQALIKASNTDFDLEWGAATGVPAGGAMDQALVKQSATDGDTVWTDIDKTFVGLDQVDNTADADKPVSTAVQTELDTLQGEIDTLATDVAGKQDALTLAAKGDLLSHTGVALAVLAAGADDQLLAAASGQSAGLQWQNLITAFGTVASPRQIDPTAGITTGGGSTMSTTKMLQLLIAKAVGAGVTQMSATTQIVAGTIFGQILILVGGDNTNVFTIVDGNGVRINGPWSSFIDNALMLYWDGTVWVELFGRRS